MRVIRLSLTAVFVLLVGARAHPQEPAGADLIVLARSIWTGDRDRARAEGVAIAGGKILAVGDRPSVTKYQRPDTRVIDRPEAFGLPGLVDAHGHLASLGAMLDELDLRGLRSPEDVAQRVAERLRQRPNQAWILGRSWDQSLWPGGQFPDSGALDAVAPDRPVWLRRVDGHAGWANSEALRRTGVGRETPDPPGGQIVRKSDGQPTGILIDAAMELVDRLVPTPTRGDVERRLLAAEAQCLALGLTGVHDAGVGFDEETVFRDLEAQGLWKLRVSAMGGPATARQRIAKPPAISPASRFEMRAIKLYIDGAMGSRGALLFEPYADDPKSTGLQLITEPELRALTESALRQGWQVATHAIGDRGNALVLDAYEQALQAVPEARDARLRIEHAQVVRRSDVGRFQALGVIASMQPAHAGTDQRWADQRLGPASERAAGAYAWRWFLDEGVHMAFGSDFPVEVPNPFWGLYVAVTRQDEQGEPPGGWHPEQRLTMDEALRGYTIGSAYAAFAEDHRGLLRPGFDADLILVDRDVFAVPARDLLRTKVLDTVIAGQVVYSRAE